MREPISDGAWFLPTRFGFGAGLPIAWQGWMVVAIHVAVLVGGALLLRSQPAATIAWALITGLVPLPLYAAKTRGGWSWRWPT